MPELPEMMSVLSFHADPCPAACARATLKVYELAARGGN